VQANSPTLIKAEKARAKADMFIAFLAYNSYTPSTAKTYVSALSFSLKCKGFQDTTQHFIVKQMLKGMSKLYGTSGMRLPITIQMIKQCPTALMHVCASRYEAVMFMSAFAHKRLKNSTGIRQGHRSADGASFLNCSTCPREI
jgi:hypothetical protein